jgi:hypothetical protein
MRHTNLRVEKREGAGFSIALRSVWDGRMRGDESICRDIKRASRIRLALSSSWDELRVSS